MQHNTLLSIQTILIGILDLIVLIEDNSGWNQSSDQGIVTFFWCDPSVSILDLVSHTRLLHGQPRQPFELNYFPLLNKMIVLSNKKRNLRIYSSVFFKYFPKKTKYLADPVFISVLIPLDFYFTPLIVWISN